MSEQKGVRNILWLFYLLDKIDEQIEIVMLMEEEERKRIQKLKEKQEAKEKSKKSKGKAKGDRVSEGKKSKKQSKKESDSDDDDSKPGAKKSKKKKVKKNGYASQEAEFDMFQRSGTRVEFLKVDMIPSLIDAFKGPFAYIDFSCRLLSCSYDLTSSKMVSCRGNESCP